MWVVLVLVDYKSELMYNQKRSTELLPFDINLQVVNEKLESGKRNIVKSIIQSKREFDQ